MRARALTIILWLQLLIGSVAAFLSWGQMFAGATGTEWTSGLKKALAAMQQSADYREPPKIRGLSYSDVIDRLQGSTYDRMHLGGYCFLTALGLIVMTITELWLLRSLKLRLVAPRKE